MSLLYVEDKLETPGRWRRRWFVPSFTAKGMKYVVGLDKEGNFGCNCPHATYRQIECKHIKAVKHMLGIEETEGTL